MCGFVSSLGRPNDKKANISAPQIDVAPALKRRLVWFDYVCSCCLFWVSSPRTVIQAATYSLVQIALWDDNDGMAQAEI